MRRLPPAVCVLAIAAGIAGIARAEWIPNGTPAGHDRTTIATDGAGGAFICSMGPRIVPTLYHLTANGMQASGWPLEGIPTRIKEFENYQYDEDPAVVSDGAGGVYVCTQVDEQCYASCTGQARELRIQRISPSGAFAQGWPAGGVGAGFVNRGSVPALASDQQGRFFVSWWGNERPNAGLYVQAIDRSGGRLWGLFLSLSQFGGPHSGAPALVPDGSGGVFIFWVDRRENGLHVIGQHVDARGRTTWAANGVPLSLPYREFSPGTHRWDVWSAPAAITDGGGGAIVAWSASDALSRGYDVHAVRVTRGGSLPWGPSLRLCGATNDQSGVRLVALRSGGGIAVWHDRRDTRGDSFYAQRISIGGRVQWQKDGVSVCAAAGARDQLVAASDGNDGAYLAWHDTRPEGMLYAVRIGESGNTSAGWDVNGTPVCARLPDSTMYSYRTWATTFDLGIADDGVGGAVLAWSDSRTNCYEDRWCADRGFAMKLLPDGPATPPTTAIASATLVPRTAAQPVDALFAGQAPLALLGSRPLASGGCEVRFSLATSEPARLDVFDLAGRRLLSRDLAAPAPGARTASIASSELSRGVFFVRLVQGERRSNSRIVLTR